MVSVRSLALLAASVAAANGQQNHDIYDRHDYLGLDGEFSTLD